MSKRLYTFEKIKNIILNKKEELLELNPDYIISIARGGAVPATMISHILNDTKVLTVNFKSYTLNNNQKKLSMVQFLDKDSIELIKNKKILIIDDIDDTRTTLNLCVALFQQFSTEIGVFVIHNKKKNKDPLPKEIKYIPGLQVPEDEWIVYPWEMEE